jgi:hypothetical protein
MKQKLIVLIVAAFTATLPAQNTMQVKRITGNDASFPIAPLGAITFTATDIVVGGPNVSIPMADIAKIYFSDVAVQASKDVAGKLPAQSGASVAASASKLFVSFTSNQPGRATVSVSNSKGQMVKVLFNGRTNSGTQVVAWDKEGECGRPVPPGIYVIHVLVDGKQFAIKQIVIQ